MTVLVKRVLLRSQHLKKVSMKYDYCLNVLYSSLLGKKENLQWVTNCYCDRRLLFLDISETYCSSQQQKVHKTAHHSSIFTAFLVTSPTKPLDILAPGGPPLNIKTTSRSASSLLVAWDPPEKTKQNGVIISYTACVSHSQDGPCFQRFISRENDWLIRHLNASTKYYIRVLASTKAGHGNYSESEGFFTNESTLIHTHLVFTL